MSYRIQGIINAFNKAPELLTGAARTTGQLIHLNALGQATATIADVAFPLTADFDILGGDKVVSAQITGVALVYVETAAGITAGKRVSTGATGLGVRIEQSGAFVLGIALATPAANGDVIPVLLTPSKDLIV